jgi:outer membrane protein assembly factor BamB
MRSTRVLVATATVLASATLVTARAAADAPWPMYHRDPGHSGAGPASPALTPIHNQWSSPHLDGDVYGEPLVADGLVIVATEQDTVYGLDERTGAIRWTTHLAAPVPRSDLPCGNINPLGITSTPVLDPALDRVFVVAEELVGSAIQHELVGLTASTGAVALRRVVDVAGMDPRAQQQRSALALAGGSVQIAFGGLDGDCSDYKGWVVSSREDGTGALGTFHTSGSRGGMWAPAGPAVDGGGNVYVATGNGSSSTNYDQGNSVLKLSAGGALLDSWAPKDWAQDNASDLDVGSTGPILLDGGLAFILGKQRTGYLLDTGHLGGIGGERFGATVCTSFGGQAWAPPMLYIECADGGLTALRVNSGGAPSFSTAWVSPVRGTGPPVIGGGAVWTEDWNAGTLSALDPATGKLLGSVATGSADHFATPAVADGLVLVATRDVVHAYTGPTGPSFGPGGPVAPTQGYWLAGRDGGVFALGTAPFLGSAGGLRLAAPVVGMASTPDRQGYWLVASDGGVFTFGHATYHGSTGGLRLARPVVAIAPTPDGGGYWLVASDGGVFTFGDAAYHGSGAQAGVHLTAPVVAIAPTPDGGGYWLATADGGVYSFGDAVFHGGASGLGLRVVAMAASHTGNGYWLAASNGRVVSAGDGANDGPAAPLALAAPVVGLAARGDGTGYWLGASDGGVFNFGSAAFAGSLGGTALRAPVVGMAGAS